LQDYPCLQLTRLEDGIRETWGRWKHAAEKDSPYVL